MREHHLSGSSFANFSEAVRSRKREHLVAEI
jgi:hypothetical protein